MKPKSLKFKLTAIAILLVLAVGGIFLYQNKNAENRPPLLSMDSSSFEGSMTNLKGFYEYTAEDVTDAKIAEFTALSGASTALSKGIHFYYSTSEISIENVIKNIKPVLRNQILIVFYDTGVSKFKVYPQGPFSGMTAISNTAISATKIPKYHSFIIISKKQSEIKNIKSEKQAMTDNSASGDIYGFNSVTEGWVLVPAPSNINDYINTSKTNARIEQIWVQNADNSFIQALNKTPLTVVPITGSTYYTMWVKIVPATTAVVPATLSVALAGNNPPAATVTSGTIDKDVLKVTFTAGTADVKITGFKLERTGTSSDTDVEIKAVDGYGATHGSAIKFNNGIATISFPNDSITVSKNTTSREIAFKMNLSANIAAGKTITVKLTNVTTEGSVTVTGLPSIISKTFTVAAGVRVLEQVLNLETGTGTIVAQHCGNGTYEANLDELCEPRYAAGGQTIINNCNLDCTCKTGFIPYVARQGDCRQDYSLACGEGAVTETEQCPPAPKDLAINSKNVPTPFDRENPILQYVITWNLPDTLEGLTLSSYILEYLDVDQTWKNVNRLNGLTNVGISKDLTQFLIPDDKLNNSDSYKFRIQATYNNGNKSKFIFAEGGPCTRDDGAYHYRMACPGN